MAEVLIEFIGDTTKLKPSIDTLNSIGAITDEQVNEFKRLQKEAENYATELTNTGKVGEQSNKKIVTSLKDVQKATDVLTNEFLEGMKDGIMQVSKETGLSIKELEKVLQGTTSTTKSLKAQLKDMTLQLAELAVQGKKDSEQYKELADRAGVLRDAIGDANEEINRAASDTRGFDNIINLAQGVTAGFAIAEGAAALFGKENEELQQTLLKVNAAMSILMGLQQLQDLANKQYLRNLLQINVAQKLQNAQLAVQAGLESKNIVIRGLATAAQWALNKAMAANPIGLIITGALALSAAVYGVIKAYDAFTGKSSAWSEQQKILAEITAKANDSFVEERIVVDEVTASIDLARKGFISKEGAVKNYNEKLGDSIGKAKDFNDLERIAVERFPAYVQMLSLKAKAQAAYALAIDASKKSLQQELGVFDIIKKSAVQFFTGTSLAQQIARDAIEGQNEVDRLLQLSVSFNTQADNIQKKFNFNSQKNAETTKQINNQKVADAKETAQRFISEIEQLQLGSINVSFGDITIPPDQIDKYKEQLDTLSNYYAGVQELQTKKAGEQEQLRQQIISAGFDAASNAINTLSEIQANARQQQLASDIAAIDKRREYELSNKNLTEQQKQSIQANYDRQTAAVKKAAFEKDKQAQITLALINGALAITNALATVQPYPAAIVAAAGAAISTGFQVAKIRSAKYPAFAKGTKNAPKGYALVGEEGAELVKLNGGESIYSASKTKAIMTDWKAKGIRNPDEVLSKMISADNTPALSNIMVNGKGDMIDYDKLGKAIAKHTDSNTLSLVADAKGLNVYLKNKTTQRQILNNRHTL